MSQFSSQQDEYAAAAIDRAMSPPADGEAMPPGLERAIIRDGEDFVGRHYQAQSRPTTWWARPLTAWSVAAVCLTLALAQWARAPQGLPSAQQLDQQLAVSATAVEIPFKGMGDPAYARVTGYVRWDDAEQSGVMRLTGLPVNLPDTAQYQLWIVDPERDENPVDGGVFNVLPGDNLIPIRATLPVQTPRAFALTLEQPGGVVVSDGPLLVIASN